MSNYSNVEYHQDNNNPWHNILELAADNSRVLDVGCSSGTLGSILMKEKNCAVVGVDLDEGDVRRAKKKLSDAHVLNIEKDDFSFLGKFDYIIFADVIEHLTDPVNALKKTKKLLKQSGSVIFSIPNMAHMGVRLMLLEGKFDYAETGLLDKTHLHFYDSQEIERVFRDAGFALSNFTWGERYIPEKIIRSRLKSIGLKPDKKFYDINREVSAIAYQYFGQAVPSDGKKENSRLAFASPYVQTTEELFESLSSSYDTRLKETRVAYRTQIENMEKDQKIAVDKILASKSWKVTKPIRLLGKVARKIRYQTNVSILKASKTPRLHPADYSSQKKAVRIYASNAKKFTDITRTKDVDVAVVLHLYYSELWASISKKLKKLEAEIPFDLYVTTSIDSEDCTEMIRKDFSKSQIFTVPNRGRDVLPFIQTIGNLQGLGYKSLLKIHSKKSPHRQDGEEWFSDILNNLIPESTVALTELKFILDKEDTAIVGPAKQYVSLTVNFDSNSYLFSKIISELFSSKISKKIARDRANYGFFAGTMFWARLDAVSWVSAKGLEPNVFEREKGAIDATTAHALERALCVVPALNEKKLYSINEAGIKAVPFDSGAIPAWSDELDRFKGLTF